MHQITRLKKNPSQKPKPNLKTIDIDDALELERLENRSHRRSRTRRAIDDTYGPKQQTKARRKLPGKRRWKNKAKQYEPLRTQMSVDDFNDRKKAEKVLKRVFKKQKKVPKSGSIIEAVNE